MRILVVEDEPKTGDYLKKGLSESGFTVDLARDGVDGLHLAQTECYDLIVLDVMLPGIHGWEVLRGLRSRSDVPVLFLTARDAVQDRVKGLELGADDYLTKPFAFAELLARVRTLLRRPHGRELEIVRVGHMEIDVAKRRVSRSGQRIHLTAKEFTLLHLLASHAGEVLSRARITSEVWDLNFDSDTNVVDVAVRRLRTKLDEPFAKKLLHTVRGMGYVLEERD
jgi:two-component system, OmpR family, copper resistance phosphate regulon response regulator CusR